MNTPLIRCLFMLVLSGSSSYAPAQNKWEMAVRAFEKNDQQTPPPAQPIVFVGSSSFTIWNSLQTTFPDKPIINRAFGGSQLSDALLYADRIILAYHPKQVVIYAGDNDLAGGRSSRTVYRLFVTLFRKLRRAQPQLAVAFVAIKPSPVRWKFQANMTVTNRLIRRYLRRQQNTNFVDVVPAMLDSSTHRPIGKLFKPDSLHMNAEGYERWATLLRPVLR